MSHRPIIPSIHYKMPLISIDTIVLTLLNPFLIWLVVLALLYTLPVIWAKGLIICFVLAQLLRFANTRYKRRGEWRSIGSEDLAVVTGGANGLGLELSKRLVERHVKVIIIDIEDISDTEVRKSAIFIRCDLGDPEELKWTIDEIKRIHGQPTILINNGAVRQDETLSDISYSKISKIMEINLMAPITLLKEFCDTREQLYVVNVSSVLGLASPSHLSIYSATKAALISLHDTISHEIQSEKVRFLLVAPGQLNTKMFKDVKPPKQFIAPLLDAKSLSFDIMAKIETGERGMLHGPLYTYFMPLLRMLPYSLGEFARWFSEMDMSVSKQT